VLETLAIFAQVAKGLAALHAMGYAHCDLKPNNILVNADGEVKLIDFGQACRLGSVKERIQGTPDFIAPEQVKREPITAKTDVFNFGATLYASLTGRNIPTLYTVKKGDNSFLVDDVIPTPREVEPEVPEQLSNLVMECIRTNPAKRPELVDVIRRLDVIEFSGRRRAAVA
jgi:serine/threonine-protein kinase